MPRACPLSLRDVPRHLARRALGATRLGNCTMPVRNDGLRGPDACLSTQVPGECCKHYRATDKRRNAGDFGEDQPTPDRCERNLQCADQGGLRGSDPQHPFSQQHRGRGMSHTKSSQQDQFIRRDFKLRTP